MWGFMWGSWRKVPIYSMKSMLLGGESARHYAFFIVCNHMLEPIKAPCL
jgi:hypothetical protein